MRNGRLSYPCVSAMKIDHRTALLDGRLRVSFQRYPKAEFSPLAAARSYGALPVGLSKDGEPMAPFAGGEALWIGLRLAKPPAP